MKKKVGKMESPGGFKEEKRSTEGGTKVGW